jgi:acyl-CoA thioesterase FadM
MTLYFRLLLILLSSSARPRIFMGDTLELSMRVLPNDLDINGHMTNARFLSVLDLGLIAILIRSRFMNAISSFGAFPIEGGVTISYRRQLTPLARYRLRIWYIGCDARWHVFGFAFLRKDGSLAASGMTRGGVVQRGRGLLPTAEIWRRFAEQTGEVVQPPELPEHARQWLAADWHRTS